MENCYDNLTRNGSYYALKLHGNRHKKINVV